MAKRPRSEYFVRSCQQLFITPQGQDRAKLSCINPWRQMIVAKRRVVFLEAILRRDGYKKQRIRGGSAFWERKY